MTEVFRLCDDYITRWAALDPVSAGMVGLSGVFGAATDYGPDGYAAREELIATTLAALGAVPGLPARSRTRRPARTRGHQPGQTSRQAMPLCPANPPPPQTRRPAPLDTGPLLQG